MMLIVMEDENMLYDHILRFNGEWRSYQQRVLNRYQEYKSDGKIHIVAAPGSGKTTLGIELIRQLDQPVLVLVPTITIREQWVDRIKEAFLRDGVDADLYISQDLKQLKLLNISTYQSVHSAMIHYQGVLIEDEESELNKHEESVDYTQYNLIAEMKNAHIGILCLDECHHLRSEWWKSLETLKKEISFPYTIALTATPPYDSSIAMWNRYIDMCGEIDEEITVPELVKEGSLCPHQDYVYFNYPTKEEEREVKDFEKKSQLLLDTLMNDLKFQSIITTHLCLHNQIDYDHLLEKPEYLSSLLIYLESQKLSYPKEFQKILGYKKLEKMSLKWMEILLQGLLFDDTKSYIISDEDYQYYISQLKSLGLIERNQVMLQMNQAIEKMLIKSVGKCESIKKIVFHEYKCLKHQLRLLILTDYIRKEYEKAVGNDLMDVDNLGVLPFFELLRRENQNLHQDMKLAVLCGSMVIIPSGAKEKLMTLVDDPDKVNFVSIGCLSEDEYVKVNIQGDSHCIVNAVSELFELGYFETLIGTKSLLGEGWDSPCVNTLILASFVGSFMLSNQMRGRAIRTFIKDPNKTSHIWHLVCVNPIQNQMLEGISEDYQTLCRRMEHFLGLNYQEDVIENGIERLSAIEYPFNKHNIKVTNKKMLKLSQHRDVLKERWDRSLAVYDQIEVVDETNVSEKMITSLVLRDAIRLLIIEIVCGILAIVVIAPILSLNGLVFYIWSVVFIILFAISLSTKKIMLYKNPLSRLQICGEGILSALKATNQIESYHCQVKTELMGVYHFIYLTGGTGHDKTLFAKSIYEFFDIIDNQRYILYNSHHKNRMDGYFVVPAHFAKRKEDADIFALYMKPFIGKYRAVYTRNEEGRKILLKGRIKALSNRQQRCITKKKVKSALE